MNNRCSVCGCVAQMGELSEYEINSNSLEICSVCRKNLTAIKQNPKEKSALAREMLFKDTNGHREISTQISLEKHFSSLGIDTRAEAVNSNNKENNSDNEELENQVNELKNQLGKLQADFYGFRKRYYLMKILSIAIPIVLVILMLIVIFASGALDNLYNYYSAIGEMAEM